MYGLAGRKKLEEDISYWIEVDRRLKAYDKRLVKITTGDEIIWEEDEVQKS